RPRGHCREQGEQHPRTGADPAALHGCNSWSWADRRSLPTFSVADCTPPFALTWYWPSRTLTCIVPVSLGSIVSDVSLMPGLLPPSSCVCSVSTCGLFVWFEMTTTMGPAPNVLGEIEIFFVLIAAVTLIGAGGRGLF